MEGDGERVTDPVGHPLLDALCAINAVYEGLPQLSLQQLRVITGQLGMVHKRFLSSLIIAEGARKFSEDHPGWMDITDQ